MNDSNNVSTKCKYCNVPYCGGDSWHRVQESDLRAAARHGHPSLALKYLWAKAKHAGEVRKKRKKEWEEQEEAKKKAKSSINANDEDIKMDDEMKKDQKDSCH